MGKVHRIIEEQGQLIARSSGDFDRREIEAATAYMADEDNGIGFLYSGWCQAALPHRRLPNGKGWQIENGSTTLIVEPGMRRGPAGEPEPFGVPYGARARLILIYLQSEAIRTKSREIELGRNRHVWLGTMGLSIGGTTYRLVSEQARRISHCRLTFFANQADGCSSTAPSSRAQSISPTKLTSPHFGRIAFGWTRAFTGL